MKGACDFFTVMQWSSLTFQTFPDRDEHKNLRGLIRIFHGTLGEHLETLKTLNRRRAGIYFMANEGDGNGRRAENVTGVRSYFCDLDGVPLPDITHFPIVPNAILETSPERYHLYWAVEGASLKTFGHVQKYLALTFGGDEKVCDLPRVMRVPGFFNVKAEPYRVSIKRLEPGVVQAQDFLDAFGVPEHRAIPPLPRAAQAILDKSRYQSGGVNTKGLDRIVTAPEGQRNSTLFEVACGVANSVQAGEVERAKAEELLIAAGMSRGLNEHEVRNTVRSAMRYAEVN